MKPGDDTLRGGDDGDGLGGGAGDDTLLGEAGVDYLYGEDGSDILRGGSDGDFMYGGNLRDQLDGGDGADFINGGADYDWMWGNFGADKFHFAGYSYHDFIMDFVDGEDKISLQGEGWGYTDVSQISISNDGNGNVFISLGYQSWITVYNTSAAQLTNADFVF